MEEPIFYINGKYVPQSKAIISINDLGVLRGYGVFDFLRTYNGRPFKLDEHLERLIASAQRILMLVPWSKKELEDKILSTLAKNAFPEANVRIVVTGGKSDDAITPIGESTLAILVTKAHIYPNKYYSQGISVVTVPLSRFIPSAKTTNYISGIMALSIAKKEQAIEALYVNEKHEVLEGTTTNFFIFKKNTLITPREGILLGITRKVVLELAKKEFTIDLRQIQYNELRFSDEAFITASNKEVMPVVRIDTIEIGTGKVGVNTKRIMSLFKEYTSKGGNI